MPKENIFKSTIMLLFLVFIALIFAESNGYYQTKTTKAKILTEEKIKQFEQDVKEGKKLDLTDYAIDVNKNYSSFLSNNIYKISIKLEKGIDTTVKYIFKKVNDTIVD